MATAASSRYLAYLPAIFQQRTAAGQEPYLGQFLLPFENTFQTFDDALSDLERYFTPALTEADAFLPWLATWIALLVDEEWDEDQRRRLLSEAVELYRWRGTTRGLRRYLEIYTGLKSENIVIHEARWPSGMQIGVASRIGGVPAEAQPFTALKAVVNTKPLAQRDYYVVDASLPMEPTGDLLPSQVAAPYQVYAPTDRVQQVMVNDGTVKMVLAGDACATYNPATILRRNALADNVYQLTLDTEPSTTVFYAGDPLLGEETKAPYRFVVEIQGGSAQDARQLLTQWLAALLNGLPTANQSVVDKALRQPLTDKARTNLTKLALQGDQLTAQLTAILCEPLTEIERFVANWQAPADGAIRTQMELAYQQLARWTHTDPLPDDLAARLSQLAKQVSALTKACVTNEARKQLCILTEQMDALAKQLGKQIPAPLRDAEKQEKLKALLKLVTDLLSQPLTIQEALFQKQQQGQRKLHAILDLEKPAHTTYYLKATPVVSKVQLCSMAIGLHSNIGLNTTIG